jgi:hypothetical protein
MMPRQVARLATSPTPWCEGAGVSGSIAGQGFDRNLHPIEGTVERFALPVVRERRFTSGSTAAAGEHLVHEILEQRQVIPAVT